MTKLQRWLFSRANVAGSVERSCKCIQPGASMPATVLFGRPAFTIAVTMPERLLTEVWLLPMNSRLISALAVALDVDGGRVDAVLSADEAPPAPLPQAVSSVASRRAMKQCKRDRVMAGHSAQGW